MKRNGAAEPAEGTAAVVPAPLPRHLAAVAEKVLETRRRNGMVRPPAATGSETR
jgi:hypothetical protein